MYFFCVLLETEHFFHFSVFVFETSIDVFAKTRQLNGAPVYSIDRVFAFRGERSPYDNDLWHFCPKIKNVRQFINKLIIVPVDLRANKRTVAMQNCTKVIVWLVFVWRLLPPQKDEYRIQLEICLACSPFLDFSLGQKGPVSLIAWFLIQIYNKEIKTYARKILKTLLWGHKLRYHLALWASTAA